MKKFNEWLAVKITVGFSTMWAFYLFFLYGLVPLEWPEYQDKILYWSNFLQLIALPALAVGGLVIAKRQEKVNEEADKKRDAILDKIEQQEERILERLDRIEFNSTGHLSKSKNG